MRHLLGILGVWTTLGFTVLPVAAQQTQKFPLAARAELGDLANTQGKPEVGPFASK